MARSTKSNKVVNEVVEQKEVSMNNEEKKFDSFAYVKGAILKEYVKNKLEGKDLKELTFGIRNYHQHSFVINYLNKEGALKVANIAPSETVDATGKLIKTYNITVKDVDINATATSKAGNQFRLFDLNSIGKAFVNANA